MKKKDCQTRFSTLYLGLTLPKHLDRSSTLHFPIIKIYPRPKDEILTALENLDRFTHIIFTSKSAVEIFFSYATPKKTTTIISVGKSTAKKVSSYGFSSLVAKKETAEGVISLLKTLNLKDAYIFWPHSSLSRPLIKTFLKKHKIKYQEACFYDTKPFIPKKKPSLSSFKEIIFTSPSTVDAFIQLFQAIPQDKIIKAIGPITKKRLSHFIFASLIKDHSH